MSNRAGKREREARNRSKRGAYSITRDGATRTSLKLGRKKGFALSRSRLTTYRWGDMAAVPVADAERRGESDRRVSSVVVPGVHIAGHSWEPGRWGEPRDLP